MDRIKDKIVLIRVLVSILTILTLATAIYNKKDVDKQPTMLSLGTVNCIVDSENIDIKMSPECESKMNEIVVYLSYFEPKLSDSESYIKIVENSDTDSGTVVVFDSSYGYVKIIFNYKFNDDTLIDMSYSYISNMYKWNYTPSEELNLQEKG